MGLVEQNTGIQGGDGGGGGGVGSKLFSFYKCLVMTLVFYELIDLKLNKEIYSHFWKISSDIS